MVATNDMHDPRRPEVPEIDVELAQRDAAYIVSRVKSGQMDANDVREWLAASFESGAIAGMAAQHKHDQEAGR